MNCSWCYGKQLLASNQAIMSQTVLRGILEALKTTPISWYILIGGEPTIHKELNTIIEKLKPTKVAIVTNAVRLSDKKYLGSLIASGLNMVALSLKGATQNQYKENTGVACLDMVEQAVANMNEQGIKYNISVTFSETIINTLPTVLQWMRQTSAVSMSINYCRPYFVDGQVSVESVPHPKEMAEKTIVSYNMIKESGVRCTFSFLLPLCLLPQEFIDTLVLNGELATVCQLQKGDGLVFEPDGSLIPCHHLFDYKLGKLGKDFTTASEFGSFRQSQVIKDFYQKTGGLPDKSCQQCSLKAKCGGGCLIQYLQYEASELVVKPF